jgi:hypothetical protein
METATRESISSKGVPRLGTFRNIIVILFYILFNTIGQNIATAIGEILVNFTIFFTYSIRRAFAVRAKLGYDSD